MKYPEAINLPFNRELLGTDFCLDPVERDPDMPGYWAIIRGNDLVVDGNGALPFGLTPAGLETRDEPTAIGRWHGVPVRAARLAKGARLELPYTAEPFNAVDERLDDRIMTIGGLALQVLHWLRRNAYCSCCSNRTEPVDGTWGRCCPNCHSEHFPHIHPCVIVLVSRGDQILLARKPGWVEGRYGLVAGFLDFGESLEECVKREVLEETGITVNNIRYVGSQNWPFPSQLMAGFLADYAGGDIRVEREELEDARWFRRDSMPLLPPPRSIARWIIDHFAFIHDVGKEPSCP